MLWTSREERRGASESMWLFARRNGLSSDGLWPPSSSIPAPAHARPKQAPAAGHAASERLRAASTPLLPSPTASSVPALHSLPPALNCWRSAPYILVLEPASPFCHQTRWGPRAEPSHSQDGPHTPCFSGHIMDQAALSASYNRHGPTARAIHSWVRLTSMFPLKRNFAHYAP